MNKYSYIPFYSYDFKNENVLSSYALQDTPLTFFANLDNLVATKVLWNFGDGTTSNMLTASKAYTYPGQYVVTFSIYDCYGNAQISTEVKTYTIYDYRPHTFTVDFDDVGWNDTLTLKNGQIDGPFHVKAYYPPYQPPTDIYYRVRNSNSAYYFDEDTKYRHLDQTHSFFERIYNNNLQGYQFNEIAKISPLSAYIYGKVASNTIIPASVTDTDAFVVGISAAADVYFKDDKVASPIYIDLFFDKTKNVISDFGPWVNNLGITLSATIAENNQVDHLSITSNGLDGEYYSVSSFHFDQMKFANVDIPFVIKIKDNENFSVKNFPLSALSNTDIYVLSGNYDSVDPSYYTITRLISSHGAVRGSMSFNTDVPLLNDIFLAAVSTGSITNDQLSSTPSYIEGYSNYFHVYPQNYITLQKKNEDFDMTETLKGLRFQEHLFDANILFDDFLGSIFGNLSSSHNTLGKRVNEKITNFVDNHQDIDRSEIFGLLSQMDMLDVNKNIYEMNQFSFPDGVKRYIDLASISNNKLFGYENKFNQNFNIRGRSSKDEYGINLGDEINTNTYIVSAGTPIVALEKFSNEYTLLNTLQPIAAPFTLTNHLNAQVDHRILNKDPSTSKSVFLSGNISYMPRNPDCWIYGIDITGWALAHASISYPGIAITRRHLAFAYHWAPPTTPANGTAFYFYDNNGNQVVRTVVDKLRVGTTDIYLILLDSDLPASIKPVRIASPEFLNYIQWVNSINDPNGRTAMVYYNQFEDVHVTEHLSTNTYLPLSASWYSSTPLDTTRLAFFETPITGDSGNPLSFIYKDDVILVGSFTNPTQGPRFGAYLTEIQNAITTINATNSVAGIYALDVVSPNNLDQYPLIDYSSDWGWPLVLPSTFQYTDFSKYYTFFEYVSAYDGTVMDYTIIPDSTLPDSKDFIFNNVLIDTLTQSLSIVK